MFSSKLIRFSSLARSYNASKLLKDKFTLCSLQRINASNIQSSITNSVIRFYANLPSVQDKDISKHETYGKMQIIFTCTVCNTRNSRKFSKVSYEKGIVIVECDGCKANHLIADNLGWFPDVGCKNIEEILATKGEKVKRMHGCWEIIKSS